MDRAVPLKRGFSNLTTQGRLYPENPCPVEGLRRPLSVICLANQYSTNSNNVPSESTSLVEACSTVDSLAIKGSTPETSGVTTFANEACESVGALASHHVPSSVVPSSEEIMDIRKYYGRPVPVVQFTSSTSQVQLFTFDGNMNNIMSFFPNGINRLTGNYGIRFKTVFTLVASATPFHQGVVVMSSNYTDGGVAFVRRDNRYYSCTNVPHVRMDVSNNTMVQHSIPFLSSIEFGIAGPQATFNGPTWFRMSIMQILPTPLPASLAPVDFQLYMHLEDIELFGAVPMVTATVVPQAGGSMMVTEDEELSHPYSSIARSAAKTMSLTSRGIPLLSSLLATPIWFAETMAKSLRSFGFSKPIIRDPIVRTVRGSTVSEQNVDLPTPCLMLAPTSTNKLAVDGQLGTNDVDEMSLPYVLSKWGQVMYGTISTAQPAGTTLYLNATAPLAQWFKTSIGVVAGANTPANYQMPLTAVVGGNAFFPSTLMAVSQLFRLWRGGMQFRITFAKTKFHGGRVLINFNPTAATPLYFSPTTGGQAQTTGQSLVFDLRDSNVVEFECPYIRPAPAIPLSIPTGLFTMVLVNKLVAPSTVSSTVDYLVEVRASPGFDLAVPAGPLWPSGAKGATVGTVVGANLASVLTSPALSPLISSDSPPEEFQEEVVSEATFEPQSGGVTTIAPTVNESIAHDSIKYTFGESISSLKQLISMPKITNCGGVPANGGDYINIPPWWYTNLSATRGTAVTDTTFSAESFGMPGNIATWYAFVNGSTECHFYTPGRPTNTCMVQWVGQPLSTYANTNDFRQTPASNVPRIIAVDEQPLHFVIPAYQSAKRLYPSVLQNVNWQPKFAEPNRAPTIPSNNSNPYIIARIRAFNNSAEVLPAYLTRCAGDDARCACFLGPAPMYLPNATTVAPYDPDSITLD